MEYLAQIILAIIAAITTILTVLLQRKQDDITDKIEKSNNILKHKQDVENQIALIALKHQSVIDKILLYILDIDINISKKLEIEVSESLKNEVDENINVIKDLSKQYDELDRKYSVLMDLYKS